jgi:hypothetical protein
MITRVVEMVYTLINHVPSLAPPVGMWWGRTFTFDPEIYYFGRGLHYVPHYMINVQFHRTI